MPYRVRDAEQVADEIRADGQPYVVFIDNNLGSRREYLHELLPGAERSWDHLERGQVTLDVTDDPTLIRAMALSGCTGVFIWVRVALGREHPARKEKIAPAPMTTRAGCISSTTMASRSTAPLSSALTMTGPRSSPEPLLVD